MARYRFTVNVAAPLEVVFDLWTNLPRMGEWVGGVTAVTDISGPVDRAGTTYIVHFGPVKSPTEVLEAERPKRFVTRFGSWILRGRSSATFEPDGEGTRLTQEFETVGRISAISSWLFSRGSYEGSFRGELQKFARIAERPTRVVHRSPGAVVTGETIEPADLSGRIVTDDFEDVFAFDVDGSHFTRIARDPAGSEFDGSWSPDRDWVVYRDSTRGINNDDEIFIASADGTDHRNLTNNPANDWGPDWSPDGTTIAFNSDRDGGPLAGYLVSPDGQLAFTGAIGSNYEIFVIDLATGNVAQLTDSPGQDAWTAWSPDGSTIAFMSVRDDCRFAPLTQECWEGDVDDEYHDIWTIRPDGTDLRRVTPELGQFVTWSPDGQYLLISGHALFVVRPDGTGRLEIRTPEVPLALGGIPDWR